MLNMRNYNRTKYKSRAYAISKDGGETISTMDYLPELIEPICQGSTLNYLEKGKISSIILFSNPASMKQRINMTVKMSKDNGQTWPYAFLIYPGPSAYSDLVCLANGKIGLLYEYGIENPYERIGFTVLALEQIENNTD